MTIRRIGGRHAAATAAALVVIAGAVFAGLAHGAGPASPGQGHGPDTYTIGLFDTSYNAFSLNHIFVIYVIFLACHTVLNLFPSHILRYWNNTSVWWHVVGPAIIVVNPPPASGFISSPFSLKIRFEKCGDH